MWSLCTIQTELDARTIIPPILVFADGQVLIVNRDRQKPYYESFPSEKPSNEKWSRTRPVQWEPFPFVNAIGNEYVAR